jgi:hypothetical protein
MTFVEESKTRILTWEGADLRCNALATLTNSFESWPIATTQVDVR